MQRANCVHWSFLTFYTGLFLTAFYEVCWNQSASDDCTFRPDLSILVKSGIGILAILAKPSTVGRPCYLFLVILAVVWDVAIVIYMTTCPNVGDLWMFLGLAAVVSDLFLVMFSWSVWSASPAPPQDWVALNEP